MSEKREFDAFVFDLDGTLLDTLPDLITVTNSVLTHFGHPTYGPEEIKRMVGYGYRSLISQAIPQDLDEETANEIIEHWKAEYDIHGADHTYIYEGIMDALNELKARGKKIGVLSNKYDAGVKELAKQYFGNLVDLALGDGPVPRKPDPTGLKLMAELLGTTPDRVAYAGDTNTDIQVAHRAGAFALGCTWGYHTREQLEAEEPHALISHPSELVNFA